MTTISMNVSRDITRTIQNNLHLGQKSMHKLASGYNYNNTSEGLVEQNAAKALNVDKALMERAITNIQHTKNIADFACNTLDKIMEHLDTQKRIATMIKDGIAGNNEATLKTQFSSIEEQVKDLHTANFNGFSINDEASKPPKQQQKTNQQGTPLTILDQASGKQVPDMEDLDYMEKKFAIGTSATDDVTLQIKTLFQATELYKGANDLTNATTAGTTQTKLTGNITKLQEQYNSFLTLKERAENTINNLGNTIQHIKNSHSDIMDVEIAEVSSQVIKDMLRVNTAALAQSHSNQMLKELISLLTNKI